MRIIIGLVTALVTLSSLSLVAQPSEDIRLHAFFEEESGSISAVLNIPAGHEPKADSFLLLEDGKTTVAGSTIELVDQSAWGLSLIFCIDTSGSMKGKPTEEVRSALNELMAGSIFRETDKIALRTFDDATRQIWWFDIKKSAITKAIDELTARGNWTVLHDALYDALNDFKQKPAGPRNLRRILLISDGKNEPPPDPASTQADRTRAEVLELALKLNIPIDFLARVRQDHVEEDLRQGHVQQIRALSDLTGGFFEFAEPGQVHEKTKSLLERIMGQQVVTFKRSIDTDAAKTTTAGIKFGTWREKLPTAIYRSPPKKEPPPKPKLPLWIVWLIVFLVILVVVYIIYRKQQQTAPKAASEKPVDKDSVSRVSKTEAPKRRDTIFSSTRNTDLPEDDNITISLDCIGGPASGNHYPFPLNKVQIGSDKENDLSVPEDEFMSAKHATIEMSSDGVLITDMNTTNGTLLNGRRLEPDTGTIIRAGDKLQMGESIFKIDI